LEVSRPVGGYWRPSGKGEKFGTKQKKTRSRKECDNGIYQKRESKKSKVEGKEGQSMVSKEGRK